MLGQDQDRDHLESIRSEACIADIARVQLLSRYRDRVVEFLRQDAPERALSVLFDMAEEFRPSERTALTHLAERHQIVLSGNAGASQEAERDLSWELLEILEEIERAVLETVKEVDALSGGRHEAAEAPSFEVLKREAVTISLGDQLPLVKLDKVERHLGGRHGFHLKPLSLSLAAGEILGVVGSNGAGKTTLLNLISGDLRPSAGSATYDGLRPDRLRASSKPSKGFGWSPSDWPVICSNIAYVPAKLEGARMRAREFMLLTAVSHGVPVWEVEPRVEETLQRYGLAQYADRRVSELSTGFRLRFEVARLTLTNASVIILDEPLANLDDTGRDIVLGDLRLMACSVQRPRAIAVSSQHIRDIETISDKIIILHNGMTLFCGAREDVAGTIRPTVVKLATAQAREMQETLHRLGAYKILSGPSTTTAILPGSVVAAHVLDAMRTAGVEIAYFEDLSDSAQAVLLREQLGFERSEDGPATKEAGSS